MIKYSGAEISRIRQTLSGNIKVGSPADLTMDSSYVKALEIWKGQQEYGDDSALAPHEPQGTFGKPFDLRFPLAPLATSDPELYQKILNDDRVKKFGPYYFFPEIMEKIDAGQMNGSEPIMAGVNRGLITLYDMKGWHGPRVIKPVQSSDEAKIATVASILGAGPAQHPSIDGYLVEDYVPGFELHEVLRAKPGMAGKAGHAIGKKYADLHKADVIYADALIQVLPTKSHVITSTGDDARLIDFGVAVDISKAPEFSLQEVRAILSMDPITKLSYDLARQDIQVKGLMAQQEEFAREDARKLKQDLLNLDLRLAKSSLGTAAMEGRISESSAASFIGAFKEAYFAH
ncbi:MAG: hypothetical protein QS98_C0003G0007 [archaeon GW2011_AR3]|nr:MAG: hypothetical protein QS98_C0003G0007 [archaeon GW2011_AR3]MBS3110050.1 hypothetical protein [Candidatus Woesearchaeota archaeon]